MGGEGLDRVGHVCIIRPAASRPRTPPKSPLTPKGTNDATRWSRRHSAIGETHCFNSETKTMADRDPGLPQEVHDKIMVRSTVSMHIYMHGHHVQRTGRQQGKVANPARGQPDEEKNFFPSPLFVPEILFSRDRLGRSFSTPRLNKGHMMYQYKIKVMRNLDRISPVPC